MTERRHQVVVVGGGFGGLSATRALAKADVDVTLVDRTNHHLFQPLLYQVAAGILPEGLIGHPTSQCPYGDPNGAPDLASIISVHAADEARQRQNRRGPRDEHRRKLQRLRSR